MYTEKLKNITVTLSPGLRRGKLRRNVSRAAIRRTALDSARADSDFLCKNEPGIIASADWGIAPSEPEAHAPLAQDHYQRSTSPGSIATAGVLRYINTVERVVELRRGCHSGRAKRRAGIQKTAQIWTPARQTACRAGSRVVTQFGVSEYPFASTACGVFDCGAPRLKTAWCSIISS